MKSRSSLNVMFRLIKLVKPLAGIMFIAIFMGCLGFCCASFLTVLGGYALLEILNGASSLTILFIAIAVIGIMRGIVHYIEQFCNHYIAFKLLALIRDKVFTSLRRLAPAKLDDKDKGNLISIITSDIELLEVFYAHTVSPICIAFITSTIVVAFISSCSLYLGLIALAAHLVVGLIIPVIVAKNSKKSGEEQRSKNGNLNTYFLDSLRGTKEIMQYDYVSKRQEEIARLSKEMENSNEKIKKHIGKTYSITSLSILSFSALMLFASSFMYIGEMVELETVVITTVMLFSSFGAVTSVANLGAGLSQTIASGNRVLDILDDTPVVNEVTDAKDVEFENANIENITFSYENNDILKDFSLDIKKNQILGITGKSGCGKSTMLKLLMRFWDVQKGEIKLSGENVKNINTASLRNNQSLVSQETHLFHDTIANNIKIANLDATEEEIIEACKKASIHEFIETLPNGYDTQVGELGDTLSGGEKQRIGIARAFLHHSSLILLDEPTSNLDSLNESVILKALKAAKDKTIVIVSHRKSTMRIADEILNMESERLS